MNMLCTLKRNDRQIVKRTLVFCYICSHRHSQSYQYWHGQAPFTSSTAMIWPHLLRRVAQAEQSSCLPYYNRLRCQTGQLRRIRLLQALVATWSRYQGYVRHITLISTPCGDLPRIAPSDLNQWRHICSVLGALHDDDNDNEWWLFIPFNMLFCLWDNRKNRKISRTVHSTLHSR